MTGSDQRRPLLGIDLGTTYTCVAAADGAGGETVLPNADGDSTTPSVVYFHEDGTALVGRAAVARRDDDPSRVVSLIKREMGRAGVTVDAGGRRYHPQQVSAVILLKAVQDALAGLGRPAPDTGPLADVVIAVPAYFGAAERKATAQAARLARLTLLDIVSEPVAAAVAHGLHRREGRTAMVYDLGGGTFDVTVVQARSDTPAKVVAIAGDHRLGGADWDRRLTDLILSRVDGESLRADPMVMARLVRQVEQVKIALTATDRHTVSIPDLGTVTVTREEYEEATADLLDRTIELTRDALELAQRNGVVAIDDLLLSGGMARTPAVAARLAGELPDLPPARLADDTDHTVARGAARLAWRASGGQEPDDAVGSVTAKGYGLAVVRDNDRPALGHGVLWMIPPGAEVPAKHHHELCTIRDGQRRMAIRVYESATGFVRGDLADDPAHHRGLIEGEITGLPAGLPKGQLVGIDLELGADGILSVHARAVNGADLRLEVEVAGAMSEPEMDAPLPGIRS
ncbi:Hsp70 family protein [Actinokineospora sp. NPDC004072]